ncbi:MAG: UPF0182 family protein [Actinobacteria bacterium]|nr:MAG: UPF0182 family protein [Actinomycetota bacterium]
MAQSARTVRRRWLIIAIGVVILIGILLSALSGFYVDLLWFREVHFSGVFWSIFWSKVLLGSVFGVLFFALLTANLMIVRRLTPRFRPFSPEQELIERYRAAIDPYARFAIPGFAAIIALFVGFAAAAQWQTFLLWKSAGGVAFGAAHLDPVFHKDPAFYIFRLPFLKYVQGWLFAALVGITVLVGIAHYFTGGIRVQTVGEKVTPQVKVHLSVLLGVILLVKAWGYYLGKFDLLVSARGVVTGASFTDIHAQKPALAALVYIAVICAVLFLVNIRFRGWILPVLGIGLLLLTSVVVGAIVPGFVQKFRVAPQELQKEEPYIARNIKATRFAYGVDVNPVAASPAPDLTADQVAANDTTISNIRLWRPNVLQQTYQALQRIQQYYEFKDVDVDRYPIQGQSRVVMLSAREVSQNGIPGGGGWQQAHLIYTHGYGAVASQVNTTDASGAPDFLLQDIPPVGRAIQLDSTPPNDHGAQIYYGELKDVPYVVVRTKQPELNFTNPSGGGILSTTYQGQGGIPMGGFFRRALFAYRYRDINLLISGLIDSQSRILINRDIGTRVRKAAPFLKFDQDPYAAIVKGRLVWIWDAYTTTDLYPYSDRLELATATNRDLFGQVNYIRNSVKAVVDAYDGTIKLYVARPDDPLIQVWQKAFPDLFTPFSQAPPELVAHFRYPEDLLQTQAFEFGRYHVTDVPTFFNNGKRWALPPGLPDIVNGKSTGTLRPYYVLIKLPSDAAEQFVLFEPFTPSGRQNMVAYIAASSDPGQYGQLKAFQFPTGENVDGPTQVRSLINQDPTVAQQLTLLSQRGSDVIFGDLLIVPIENAFLYVQPIFVTASSGQLSIPELKRVVVVHGGNVAVANSLSDALDVSFGRAPGPTPGGGTPGATVSDLLALALQHFQKAQQFLQQGNLSGYQAEINAAQNAIQQANNLVKGGGPTPSPSPSP